MSKDDRRGLGGHPVIVLISVIASIIGITAFLTGKQRLSDFLPRGTAKAEAPSVSPEQPQSTSRISPQKHGSSSAKLKRPELSETPSTGEVVVILDPSEAKDIWTTSIYSYGPSGGGPGGGLDDAGLRVGGWGDWYYSLIRFKIDSLPKTVVSARLKLYSLPFQQNDGPSPLLLDRVLEPWDWEHTGTGPDHKRLWWADRPGTEKIAGGLPAPTPGSWYSIDITSIYNSWQAGEYANYGLQIRPTRNDHRGSIFVSSEGLPELRPRLVLRVKE